MKGDREIGIEQMMDDYLTKPYNTEDLRTILARWLGPASEQGGEGEKSAEVTPGRCTGRQHIEAKALDAICALDTTGSGHLLEKVVGMFFKSSPVLLSTMHDAMVADDRDAIRRSTRSLKSAGANLGALPLSYLCREQEAQSCNATLEGVASLVADIEAEHGRALVALQGELERRS
jgi:HPt (histidine-containing phosphotransfer) domain-containing protein